jgi:multiple RNA-binding domain-containing protein 1
LYLEWAPKDIWDSPAPAAPAPGKAAAAAGPKPAAAANGVDDSQQQAPGKADGAAAAAAADDDDGDQAPTVSIYVKNLNFATSDASLKNHFDKVVSAAGGQVHSAKVGV